MRRVVAAAAALGLWVAVLAAEWAAVGLVDLARARPGAPSAAGVAAGLRLTRR